MPGLCHGVQRVHGLRGRVDAAVHEAGGHDDQVGSDRLYGRAGELEVVVRKLVQVPAQLSAALTPGCLSLMAQLPPDAFRNFREA